MFSNVKIEKKIIVILYLTRKFWLKCMIPTVIPNYFGPVYFSSYSFDLPDCLVMLVTLTLIIQFNTEFNFSNKAIGIIIRCKKT